MGNISANNKKKFFLAILALVAILLPLILNTYFQRHSLILILIWSIAGMGWNIIGGYAGQVSNGHALFYAIGAYSCALGMKFFNITPWISIMIGIILASGIAFLIGTPLLRLKGHYFSVATMAVGECARYIFQNWDAIGGSTGVDFINVSYF